MGAGVGRPHVQMLCRYGVLPPCRGGLSSLTYGCFSSGAGPPALGPEASPTPSWNGGGSLVGRGLLVVPHDGKSCCRGAWVSLATSKVGGGREKAGVGGGLRPAVWDQLTSPILPTRQNNDGVPHLDLHGFLRPEHLVGGSGAPPPKQAHTVGP